MKKYYELEWRSITETPDEYTFLNCGIGGSRVLDVYARIKSDIINLRPDVISILIGVNDVWHEVSKENGVDAEKYFTIYSMMIEATILSMLHEYLSRSYRSVTMPLHLP